jgi:hypothetical protein
MIHGEIIAPNGRAERNGYVQKPSPSALTRGELNDFGAHENPSHNAIAIRPAKASEIKYAVMPASFHKYHGRATARKAPARRGLRLSPIVARNRPATSLKKTMRHDCPTRSFQTRTLSLPARSRSGSRKWSLASAIVNRARVPARSRAPAKLK